MAYCKFTEPWQTTFNGQLTFCVKRRIIKGWLVPKQRMVAMKIRVFVVVLSVAVMAAIATTAQAQQITGFVESWNDVSEAGVTPQVNVLLNGPIKGDFGWTAWTLTSKAWGEALVGLTYKPAKWVEVSGSVGLEHVSKEDNSLRLGASVFAERGRFSILSIREEGVDHWYRHLGKFQVSDTVAVGIENRRFFGTGPYAEVKFGKIVLWGDYAISNNKGVVGVRLKF